MASGPGPIAVSTSQTMPPRSPDLPDPPRSPGWKGPGVRERVTAMIPPDPLFNDPGPSEVVRARSPEAGSWPSRLGVRSARRPGGRGPAGEASLDRVQALRRRPGCRLRAEDGARVELPRPAPPPSGRTRSWLTSSWPLTLGLAMGLAGGLARRSRPGPPPRGPAWRAWSWGLALGLAGAMVALPFYYRAHDKVSQEELSRDMVLPLIGPRRRLVGGRPGGGPGDGRSAWASAAR